MDNFTMQAKRLCDGGYSIVPINKGQKGPLIKEWQKKTFTADDIDAGIGVKCGIGDYPVCAIDIDVLNPELAAALAQWCHDHLGMTVERVGQAPKTMLVYRAGDSGWSKAASRWFTDSSEVKQRVEILGKGQQFVAYHIHPDTKEPYEWTDMLGGLEYTPASELPIVTADEISQVLEVFEQMALDAGMQVCSGSSTKTTNSGKADPEDFTAGAKVGVTLKEAAKLLNNLDAADYDRWLQVGMALHHEYDGSDEAFNVWDDWSQKADNYSSAEDLEKRWSGFGHDGGGITIRTLLKWGNDANAQQKRAQKRDAIQDYKDRIDACIDGFELEEVLKAIGTQLDKTEVITCNEVRATAKAKYKAVMKQSISDSSINTLLGLGKDTSAENLERQMQYTEFGNARKMLELFGDNIMFAADTETWYRWTGSYWRIAAQSEIEQLSKATLMQLIADGAEQGVLASDQYDFVKNSLKAAMMTAMVKIIRTEKSILVNTGDLDANKMLFGVSNGAIDLTTGDLIPSDRLDRITIASSTKYKPDAKCPLFGQTVSECFYGDTELVEFFQRLMGYTLLADPKEDIIVIPYGTGSNGKSTVLGAIRDAMGAHAITASNETFLGSGGANAGGPRDDILRLRGSRFVYVTEPDEDRELKEGLIKSMTGGEAMAARAAYSRTFVQFTPTWTVILPTNHKPIIKGDDFGIWRRIMLVPFTRNFSTDPDIVKDNDRSEKLKAEYEGILAWLVRGAMSYLEMGLNPPAIVEEARNEYKSDMDLLAEWIEECCEIGRDEVATNAALWASWKQFAEVRGELRYISNARTLNKKLEARTYVEKIRDTYGIRGRGLLGISVKDDFENVESSEA
ncbi:phage/plasmid primase, P4 family [uncultured Psychrobacter sp.]|uniref:phage/plasmid primase, P4 family n=1 Tax=uncultured Psychrobacter sp. TaxID=259303 RepID=UPI002639B8AE|nr:phage/plasmid primase, P4 family [uncultured Psychrobacter sp.]